MRIVFQPANSPDFNVLDFGFISSIQSLLNQTIATDIDDLVSAEKVAFQKTCYVNLKKFCLSLQKCPDKAIQYKGGNEYRMPHGDIEEAYEQSYQLLQPIGCTADV